MPCVETARVGDLRNAWCNASVDVWVSTKSDDVVSDLQSKRVKHSTLSCCGESHIVAAFPEFGACDTLPDNPESDHFLVPQRPAVPALRHSQMQPVENRVVVRAASLAPVTLPP